MGDAAEYKRRAEWGYEPNTPVCGNCAKYRKARIAPKGRVDPPFCVGGKFSVHANGCCDRWRDKKTGEGLAHA
jgi:hypothetical protein